MKQQLIDLLEAYKFHMNFNSHNGTIVHTIELFSGIKPSGYYTPCVMEYLDYPPYSERKLEQFNQCWFVEIWINELCIWRQSTLIQQDFNPIEYEEKVIKVIMHEIAFCGISSNWKTIQALKNKE